MKMTFCIKVLHGLTLFDTVLGTLACVFSGDLQPSFRRGLIHQIAFVEPSFFSQRYSVSKKECSCLRQTHTVCVCGCMSSQGVSILQAFWNRNQFFRGHINKVYRGQVWPRVFMSWQVELLTC